MKVLFNKGKRRIDISKDVRLMPNGQCTVEDAEAKRIHELFPHEVEIIQAGSHKPDLAEQSRIAELEQDKAGLLKQVEDLTAKLDAVAKSHAELEEEAKASKERIAELEKENADLSELLDEASKGDDSADKGKGKPSDKTK